MRKMRIILNFRGKNFDRPFRFSAVKYENGWETYNTFREEKYDSVNLSDFLYQNDQIRIILENLEFSTDENFVPGIYEIRTRISAQPKKFFEEINFVLKVKIKDSNEFHFQGKESDWVSIVSQTLGNSKKFLSPEIFDQIDLKIFSRESNEKIDTYYNFTGISGKVIIENFNSLV